MMTLARQQELLAGTQLLFMPLKIPPHNYYCSHSWFADHKFKTIISRLSYDCEFLSLAKSKEELCILKACLFHQQKLFQ